MVDRIMRFNEVTRAVGASRQTLYNRISDGLFPRPVTLGPRMVGWPEYEIAAINRARIRGASVDEIRALVAEIVAARTQAAA